MKGELLDLDDLAWQLHMDGQELKVLLVELSSAGLVEPEGPGWRVLELAEPESEQDALIDLRRRWREQKRRQRARKVQSETQAPKPKRKRATPVKPASKADDQIGKGKETQKRRYREGIIPAQARMAGRPGAADTLENPNDV